MRAEVTLKLIPARQPNYLKIEGVKNGQIDVGVLTDDQVNSYLESAAEAFRDHVKKRRSLTPNTGE